MLETIQLLPTMRLAELATKSEISYDYSLES
jgi:hypothetical protein